MICPGCGAPDGQGCYRNCPETAGPKARTADVKLRDELIGIKRRLEALEQRVYTIDQRTIGEVRLGPGPMSPSPYNLNHVADIVNKHKKSRK